MPDLSALRVDPSSTRGKILSKVDPDSFKWAIPIMRSGYAGRGLVYLAVAGLSLWSVAQGGEAQSTGEAFDQLSGGWGSILIGLIVAGLVSYALWRTIDCIWDLEAYGTDTKGIIARGGMLVTGLLHLGIAFLAASSLGAVASGSGSGGSGTQTVLSAILASPGGRAVLAVAGAVTFAAGIYYFHKAYTRSYRDALAANPVTRDFELVLRFGVAAQGAIVCIIGGLLMAAGLRSDTSGAGGLGAVFDWLQSQSYGTILVGALCVGLLGFAVFCFVNAIYRVVPKAAGDDVQTLSAADAS